MKLGVLNRLKMKLAALAVALPAMAFSHGGCNDLVAYVPYDSCCGGGYYEEYYYDDFYYDDYYDDSWGFDFWF